MTKHTPSRLARDYIWITLGAVMAVDLAATVSTIV